MTNWEAIREEYENTEITMKELAVKHGVKPGTLRSRKNRENWDRATQQERVATQRNKVKNVATQEAVKELEDNDELTDKRKQFCLLYLRYFSATKAYKEAYGVSQKTAEANAYRLMEIDGVKKEIARLKQAQRADMYVDSLDLKKEWLKQAFADINDFIIYGKKHVPVMGPFGPLKDEYGNTLMKEVNYVDFKESTELDGTLIKSVKMGQDGPVIQLYDKHKAMDRLMDFLVDKDETEELDDGFLAALKEEAGDLWPDE